MAVNQVKWPATVTATVQSDPRALAQLIDPALRKNQYVATLKWTATHSAHIGHMVSCENSGYDLRKINACRPDSQDGLSLEVSPGQIRSFGAKDGVRA
jgi:hypothetical protein